MTTRVWTITVDGQEHEVEVVHRWVTGLRRVRVDGQVVHRVRGWFTSAGLLRAMPILDDRAQVWLVTHNTTYSYFLLVDGQPTKSGHADGTLSGCWAQQPSARLPTGSTWPSA